MKAQLDNVFVQKKGFEERLAELRKKEADLDALSKLKIKELGENGVREHEKLEKGAIRLGELVQSKKTELAEISFRYI